MGIDFRDHQTISNILSPMKNVLCNKIHTEKNDMNADVQTVTAHTTVVYDYDNRKEKSYE